MNIVYKKYVLSFCICALFYSSMALSALGINNNQLAEGVLGQLDFITFASGLTASEFQGPRDVLVDEETGKIFVVDTNNSRILRFSSNSAFINGAEAEMVLGQIDFVSNVASTGIASLNFPNRITMEAGTLWVSDTGNHRILRFDNASIIKTGAEADQVLGQTNFDSQTSGLSDVQLNSPIGLSIKNNVLWVADTSNSRVLRYDNVLNKANGSPADGVLGQSNFNTSDVNLTIDGLYAPADLEIDEKGNLWISDTTHNRILRFDNAVAKENGADANGVLGQPDFNTSDESTTQFGFDFPFGLSIYDDYLFVADSFNHRVLVFENVHSIENGSNASFILGQSSFLSGNSDGGGIVDANSFDTPVDVFFNQNNLWVVDRSNHRLMRFYFPEVIFKDGFE